MQKCNHLFHKTFDIALFLVFHDLWMLKSSSTDCSGQLRKYKQMKICTHSDTIGPDLSPLGIYVLENSKNTQYILSLFSIFAVTLETQKSLSDFRLVASLGGRFLITLTKFCPLLTTCLPLDGIGAENLPLLQEKICILLTIPVTPTYLLCQCCYRTTPTYNKFFREQEAYQLLGEGGQD